MEKRTKRRAPPGAVTAGGAKPAAGIGNTGQDGGQDAGQVTPLELSPEMEQFVESMGRYFEQYGIARIGGRILGLLMIADRPLSLDEIATCLRVSRASVSTNIRLATASDLAELVTFPGDRRDYYVMIEDAWGHGLSAEMKAMPPLRRIAERALEAVGPEDSPTREKLEEMVDFCDFVMEERRGMLERWQALRAARQHERSTRDETAR